MLSVFLFCCTNSLAEGTRRNIETESKEKSQKMYKPVKDQRVFVR